MAGENREEADRIGVLGGGQVFERLHLPALRRSRECRLVAVAEPSAPRREWLAEALPGVPLHAEAAELLARPDLDAVLVLTPPATHADLTVAALRAGHAVLVEKPLAGNPDDAQAVLAAAAEAGRPVQVGFNRRFRRTHRDLKRTLAGEAAGRFDYLFRADTGVWRAGRATADPAADRAHLLQDVASHQLDLVPWLRSTEIAEVRARSVESSATTELEIGLQLTDGSEAILRAAHGEGYAERLEAEFPSATLVAYPGAVINSSRWRGGERLLGRAASVGDLALARFGVRPTRTAESLDLQLATFLAKARGRPPDLEAAGGPDDGGADAAAGLRVVLATAACQESLRRNGAWVPLDPNRAPGAPKGS